MHKRHYKCLLIAIYFFCQFSFAQSWKSLNGPIGADISASMITKEKGNIFVFTTTQRAFISEDKGKTWTEYSSGIQKLNFNYKSTIKESPTGEIFLSNFEHLYKFNNSSKIWEKKFGSSDNIEDFNFSPDGTNIYLALGSQFLISKNGGSFTKVVDWSTHSAEFLCLGNNNNFVRRTLGASGQIWKFNDDGSQLKVILASSCCQKLFHHKKSNTLFDLDYSYYRYSNNYGATWKTNSFPNNLNFSNLVELNDGSLLSYYRDDFYISKDNGINWNISKEYLRPIKNIEFFNQNNQITISKDGNIVVQTQNFAIYFEPNQKAMYLELPLKETSIKHAFTLSNNDCYTSLNSGTQFTKDEGVNWNQIDITGNDQFVVWNDGTIGILYFIYDSISLTKDLFKTVIKRKLPRNNLFYDVMLDSKENLLLFAFDSIYISYDKAESWVPTGKMNFISDELKISKQNILYSKEAVDNISYSLDYGLNWYSIQLMSPLSYSEIYLTANNVFYWMEVDRITGISKINFTHNFGKTNQTYNIPSGHLLLFVDDYENLYFRTNTLTELKVLNIFNNTESTLSLQGLDLKSTEHLTLYQGKNDYLYAYKASSPLYKFSEKIQNDYSRLNSSIYIDQNDDCKVNNAESLAKSIQLELNGKNNNYSLSFLYDGKYLAYVSPDTYEVKIKDKNSIWELCNFPSQLQVFPNQDVILDSLIIKPKLSCVDLITGLSLSRLRRCFEGNQAFISIRNEGTIDAKDTKVEIILDDYFTEVTCNVNPLSRIGNLWTFDVPSIKVGETFRITFTFKVSCDARLNQEHCIKGIIEDKNDCFLPLQVSDTIIICDENIGSFDPNDKMVYINGIQNTTFHKTDSVLEYLIRFQNTGTDTAFTVVIKDQLDYNLDWSSLTPISASHDYSYFLNDNGTMEIKFANILLPDSSINYIGSNGYFKYNIKPKKDLNFGTKIFNEASIYFDFNEPVVTNLTQIQLVPILGTKEVKPQETIQLTAIPNPFSESCTIILPAHWKNKNLQYHIASSEGKHHSSHFTKARDITIQRDELKAGIYFVYLIDDRGNKAYCRVVVQ
jgi:uncharacterized repeat protein (TIGR01451 family)